MNRISVAVGICLWEAFKPASQLLLSGLAEDDSVQDEHEQ